MKKITIGAGSALLAVAACVSVDSSILTRAYTPFPVPASEVTVFYGSDTIPEHERVAILFAKGEDMSTNPAKMIDAMRKEAGKLGANAIILNYIDEPETGDKVAAAAVGVPTYRRGEALAIYVPSLDRRETAGLKKEK